MAGFDFIRSCPLTLPSESDNIFTYSTEINMLNWFRRKPVKLRTVQGDLLKLFEDGHFDTIVHGCNCFHAMTGGIAAQIARKFPGAVEVDNKTPYGSANKLGDISIFLLDDGRIIINGYTQFNPGADVNYDAIDSVFRKVGSLSRFRADRVGYPAIGAGIAGGDWTKISRIIRKRLRGVDHTFVEFKP